MNVGLTRARSSLWILGDTRALNTDANWHALVTNARERQALVDVGRGAFDDMARGLLVGESSGIVSGVEGAEHGSLLPMGARVIEGEKGGGGGGGENGIGRGKVGVGGDVDDSDQLISAEKSAGPAVAAPPTVGGDTANEGVVTSTPPSTTATPDGTGPGTGILNTLSVPVQSIQAIDSGQALKPRTSGSGPSTDREKKKTQVPYLVTYRHHLSTISSRCACLQTQGKAGESRQGGGADLLGGLLARVDRVPERVVVNPEAKGGSMEKEEEQQGLGTWGGGSVPGRGGWLGRIAKRPRVSGGRGDGLGGGGGRGSWGGGMGGGTRAGDGSVGPAVFCPLPGQGEKGGGIVSAGMGAGLGERRGRETGGSGSPRGRGVGGLRQSRLDAALGWIGGSYCEKGGAGEEAATSREGGEGGDRGHGRHGAEMPGGRGGGLIGQRDGGLGFRGGPSAAGNGKGGRAAGRLAQSMTLEVRPAAPSPSPSTPNSSSVCPSPNLSSLSRGPTLTIGTAPMMRTSSALPAPRLPLPRSAHINPSHAFPVLTMKPPPATAAQAHRSTSASPSQIPRRVSTTPTTRTHKQTPVSTRPVSTAPSAQAYRHMPTTPITQTRRPAPRPLARDLPTNHSFMIPKKDDGEGPRQKRRREALEAGRKPRKPASVCLGDVLGKWDG